VSHAVADNIAPCLDSSILTTVDSDYCPHSSGVRQLIDDLRAAGQDLDLFVKRQLDALAAIGVQLDERRQQLDARQQSLDEQAEQLEHRSRSLAALRQLAEQGAWRVQQEADRLARMRSEATAAGTHPDEPANAEATELRRALHEAETRLASMAGIAADLIEARRDIVRLQTRLMKQANRLAEAKGHFATAAGSRIQQLEGERARLALELDLVRGQLQQQAESDVRARADERRVWLGEIKRLRQAIERPTLGSSPRDRPVHCIEASEACLDQDASLDQIVARLESLQNEIDATTSGQAAQEGSTL
jgi:chromosome segregation ATPase